MFTFEYTTFAAYQFMIFAVILFVSLRVLSFLIPYVLPKVEIRKWFYKYFPAFEVAIWIVFCVWAVQFFMQKNQLYALSLLFILIVFVLVIIWYSKDLIAGVVFKTDNKFKVKDTVRIKNFTGIIKTLGYRSIEIETETGETVFLPYNSVLSEILIKSHQSESILNHTFRMNVKKTIPVKELVNNIRTSILYLPWSSLKKEPQIKPISEDSDQCEIEITVYSPESTYFYKIENNLREKFSI